MRSAGDFDAMWRDMAQTSPNLWAIAHEPLPGLFSPWEPRFDFIEQEDAYLLRAQLPGIQRDDMTVEYHNGVLTVRGEQSREADTGQDGPRIKHGSRAFARRFVLAEPVEASALAITYTHDGLEVYIPKAGAVLEQCLPVQAA
jgi:HSP20 family molecular chaperone IbpA